MKTLAGVPVVVAEFEDGEDPVEVFSEALMKAKRACEPTAALAIVVDKDTATRLEKYLTDTPCLS